MAEPLILFAEAPLSARGFKQWLASPLTQTDCPGIEVADFLADLLGNACGTSAGNFLLCRHDASTRQLQLAVCLYDGTTEWAQTLAAQLHTLCRQADDFRAKREKRPSVVGQWDDMTENAPASPPWLETWLAGLDELPMPEEQTQWLDSKILSKLACRNAILSASPEQPVYIGWLYTDGKAVYADVAGKTIYNDAPDIPEGQRFSFTERVCYVLEGLKPESVRQLSECFYTDGETLWYCNVFSGNPPQALGWCDGRTPQIHHLTDTVPDTLVVLGDNAWSEAFDDSKVPHERLYVKQLAVEGETFRREGKSPRFQDRLRQYRFYERLGLCPQQGNSD
ncbi:hypothetical protein [uncultured Aquitalea sp.]|uniref:hypothetical protein n=1 Tax=uncultured Aquitalea sp. TaxID=540272 RepID=UPI0025F4D6D5|nr:hypothetical protein [uncultured Aquitalea sp.]